MRSDTRHTLSHPYSSSYQEDYQSPDPGFAQKTEEMILRATWSHPLFSCPGAQGGSALIKLENDEIIRGKPCRCGCAENPPPRQKLAIPQFHTHRKCYRSF